MADETAAFSEILEVGVDVPKFQQGLEELRQAYSEWVKTLGDDPNAVVGAGMFAGLKEQIQALVEDSNNVQAALVEAVQGAAAQISQIAESLDSKLEGLSQKKRDRAKTDAEAQVAAAKQAADAQASMASDGGSPPKFYRDLATEQEGVQNAAEASQKRQVELAREIATEQEGIVNAAAEAQAQLETKTEAFLEKQAADKRAIYEQDVAAAEAEYERQAQIENSLQRQVLLAREIATEQEGVSNAATEANAKEAAAAQQQALEIEQARASLWERIVLLRKEQNANDIASEEAALAIDRERVATTLNSTPTENQAAKLASMERQVQVARQINQEQNSITENQTKQVGLMDSMLGKTIQAYAVWTLLSETIKIVTSIIEAPFKAIADGLNYLEQTEQVADKLTGVLNANVKFSSDLVENFRLAQQAAQQVTVELQRVSAQTGVPIESLKRTLTALVDAGGAGVVSDTTQLVQLTVMFSQALQAAGRDASNTRAVIGDLPKLLNGTLQPTSALLQALHLTSQEAKDMVASAKEHGNLVELLAPKLQPYLDAVTQASMHHTAMLESLNLITKQIEGIAAQPVYDEINTYIANIVKWAQKNRDLLSEWAALFGRIAAYLVKIGTDSANLGSTWGKLAQFLGEVAIAAGESAASIKLLVSGLLAAASIDLTNPSKSVGQAIVQMAGAVVDFNNNIKQALDLHKQLEDQVAGKGQPVPTGPTSTSILGVNGEHPTTDRAKQSRLLQDEWKAEEEAFKSHVESIQENYKQLVQATQSAEASRTISHKQAADQIAQYSDDEKRRIDILYQALLKDAQDYRAKIVAQAAAAGKDSVDAGTKFDTALQSLQNSINKVYSGSDSSVAAARKAANNEQFALAKEHANSLIQIQQDEATKEAAIAKELFENGYLTQAQYLDKQVELARNKYTIDTQILENEAQGLNHGTVEYQTNLDKRIRIEAQYTEQMRQYAVQRANVLEQESIQREQYNDKLAAAAIKQEEVLSQGTHSLAGNPSINFDETLYTNKQKELDQLITETQRRLEAAQAKNAETSATMKLSEALADLYTQRFQSIQSQAQAATSGYTNPAMAQLVQQGVYRDALGNFHSQSQSAQNNLDNYKAGLDQSQPLSNEEAKMIAVLSQAVQDRKAAEGKLQQAIEDSTSSFSDQMGAALNQFVGFNVSDAWGAAQNNLQQLAVAANVAGGAFKQLPNILNQVQNGLKQGGVLGGIGAGVSALGSALKDVPIVGQFAPAIGAALSFIGQLFTQAAQRVADDAKKQFQNTITQFNEGNSTLMQTISTLESQRNAAIASLSGKKGGQDQLNNILPQFDQEIASLKQQQTQIITNFETQLGQLQLQSSTLAQVNQQWDQINQSVKDYINAGGDAVKAQQFLSLSLQQMQVDAQNQLNQGQQQAIQDALSLNDLLQQRLQLDQQYKQQVFDLANQDAIERVQAGSVTRAQQLQNLKDQYDQQSQQLTEQISLTQQKVDKESQIFQIATTIDDLHRQDDALTLAALDQQIAKYTDLQKIVNSISLNPNNGLYQAASGLFNNPQFNIPITVTVSGNVTDPTGTGAAIAGSISQQLQQNLRGLPQLP